MPLGQIVIAHNELRRGRLRVRPDVRLQGPERRVRVGLGIRTDQGRPVPAGPDRQDRVEWRRGLIVLALGEQPQCKELVNVRIVGHLAERLLSELDGQGVVALLEGVAGLVEVRGGLGGHGAAGAAAVV